MTARRRMLERRLKLRRRLIKQVARRFYARLERRRLLANDLVQSVSAKLRNERDYRVRRLATTWSRCSLSGPRSS